MKDTEINDTLRSTIKRWNNTSSRLPENLCIHDLFEQQARKTPNAVAVTFGNATLTYQELDNKSNQLAHYLLTLEVGPNTLVGLCLERSFDMVIGILAILKTGAAYVPIDTEYPEERISYILENSNVPFLLTHSSLKVISPDYSGAKIFLDKDWAKISSFSKSLPNSKVTPKDLIYVIHTSGSTGKPKGTLLYHYGFLNLLYWYTTEFDFGPESNVLLISSTSFDLTQKNIFAPLICGGNLVLLDSPVFDANIIENTIKKNKITSINCTPSAFQGIVTDASLERFKNIASLKQVFLGGEPILVSKIAKWLANEYCRATVINSYGPTECTDVCAYYKIEKYINFLQSNVPIGRPICNTQLYIVNDDLSLTPLGEEGELCVAGAGVGAGYLNRKDLTDERFIPNPFARENTLMYKTGDRTRFLPDGNIEYLGRIDQQVKIRGFRIELGEIESVLDLHPDVKESVVVGHDKKNGEKHLVAYIVPQKNIKPETNIIRSFLQKSLPDYMLPTAWVFINKIPLTPNGKIDKKALPSPEGKRPNLSQQFIPPASALEVQLSSMWSDILELDRIGVEDPFFELGGTSLQSIQFISRLSKKLGESIPIASFFAAPTIKGCIQIMETSHLQSLINWMPDHKINAPPRTLKLEHSQKKKKVNFDDIAIIGMSGRFPGAENIDEFWENLAKGVESVRFASNDDLRLSGVSEDDIQDDEYVRNYFSADDLDGFDAEFFGYQPREVESMDPQHRLFLELAWTALDNAGYSKNIESAGRVGVFGGAARDAYLHNFVSKHPQYKDSLGEFHVNIGNDKNFPCTRVAYKLNLKGPAVNVQTACSTSGVALHLACQNLHLGECDMAIVGGCRVLVPTKLGYPYVEGSALSLDGHLYTFDARGTGMVRGSGGAFLVIKRLNEAIQDGDCIRAIIKSSAINNDGNAKAGYTAPSVEGQSEVIEAALEKAGLSPESIGYLEAHGTATAIGDPIEVMALNKAYRRYTDKNHFCYLGSVKTNIGHLDAGAANAGIIKSVLAIEHAVIPPSLNYRTPNPSIDFANSPFTVNTEPVVWRVSDKTPRRAGVSAFGLGGTNFHIILEQAPTRRQPTESIRNRSRQLVTLSAKSAISLNANLASLPEYIDRNKDIPLSHLAYSLNAFRPQFEYRAMLLFDTDETLSEEVLVSAITQQVVDGAAPVAFFFPPGGDNVLPSLAYLIEHEPQSHRFIDKCCQAISSDISFDSPESRIHFLSLCDKHEVLVFIFEYVLASLWIAWGINPAAVCGSGTGNFVAACISGALSLSDGLKLLTADRDLNQTNLTALLNTVYFQAPKITMVSSLNGLQIERQTMAETLSVSYLGAPEILQESVLEFFSAQGIKLLLETGTQTSFLSTTKDYTTPEHLKIQVISSFSNKTETPNKSFDITETLGKLWLSGQPIDWQAYYKEESVIKIPLPPYKFHRQRYWLDLPGIGPKIVLFEADTEEELNRNINHTIGALRTYSDDSSDFPGFSKKPTKQSRMGFVVRNSAEALQLISPESQSLVDINHQATPHDVVFMFSGGGAQYLQMGRGLYERFAVFRASIDEGLALFSSRTGYNLKNIWFAPAHLKEMADKEMGRPSVQLPAIFILEMALTRLWQSWGIQPSVLIGHSLGENTAACVSGVFNYPDALGLVTLRGKLFEKTEAGAMLSVPLPAEELSPMIGSELDIATINSPWQCVVSGKLEHIEQLNQLLAKKDIEAQVIPISTAAHSRLLEPVLNEFGDYLRSITLQPPKIPFVSNVTGDWIKEEQATDPGYWVNHLRSTVRFADGLQTVIQSGDHVFLETGPGKILCSLVKSQQPKLASRLIPSLRHPREESHDLIFLMQSITRLLVAGIDFNWHALSRDFPETIVVINTDSLAVGDVKSQPQTIAIQPGQQLPAQIVTAYHPPTLPVIQERSSSIMSRKEFISSKLSEIISEMSGLGEQSLDHNMSFLNMGFDSLFLTQANNRIKKTFKVKTTLRHLLREAPTIEALSKLIDQELPPDAFQDELTTQDTTIQTTMPIAQEPLQQTIALPQPIISQDSYGLQQAIALQIQASNALLACLHGSLGQQPHAPSTMPSSPLSTPSQVLSPPPSPKVPIKIEKQANDPGTTSHGPFVPMQKSTGEKLTDKQTTYLSNFIVEYTKKTKNSKLLAERTRAWYADPRTVMGFKTIFKEMTYTLAGKRSKGSRVWDIDDNEYVDCMGGFGSIFFGHAPDFIIQAVHKQLDQSIDYGPQTSAAERVARLVCKLTGMERVSFCNTGSEATLAAMRIARTVTGNEIIVMFKGSYHGIFDEVLVRPQEIDGAYKNFPVAPGIPQSASDNILMLDYGDPKSIEIIREKADSLAGVIVEPIQSRNPELQPKQFLHDLRKITHESDIPMIFDEMITGFRLHPKGAQGWYDVTADIACYGKVIGGGFPVGVIAGKREYMDALDGGHWQFGDDSFPEVGVTYFAGTFVRHPVALAAMEAVLLKFKEEGPALQEQMNKKTAIFAERVNRRYRQLGIPIKLVYFGSAFFIRYHGQKDFEPLFWHHLRYYGAHHMWGNRPGFLTVAHTEDDINLLVSSFEQAGIAMQTGGFLPKAEDYAEEHFLWTSVQSEIWLAIHMNQSAAAAYNEQVMFEINNCIDQFALELAVDITINRHQSLRSVVNSKETGLLVKSYMCPIFKYVDLSSISQIDHNQKIKQLALENINTLFDLKNGPLIRSLLVKLEKEKFVFCVSVSHLVCDGWSLEIVMEDIANYYTGICQSRYFSERYVPSLQEFVNKDSENLKSKEFEESKEFWLSVYKDDLPPDLDLPLDRPRPPARTYVGERHNCYLDDTLVKPMRELARESGCTFFVLLLTAYVIFLKHLSRQNDIVVGIPAAGQPFIGMPDVVAHAVSLLPLRIKVDESQLFHEFLLSVLDRFMEAKDNQSFSYGELLKHLPIPRNTDRQPLFSASFNVDMAFNPLKFDNVLAHFIPAPRGISKVDLLFTLTDEGDKVLIEVDRNADIIDAETADRWISQYQVLLREILRNPHQKICEINFLSELDKQKLFTEWNPPINLLTSDPNFLCLFEKQAGITPHKTAVHFKTATLSYQELDHKANQYANHFRSRGVHEADLVGICIDRSEKMLLSLLGILKSGAAYVPLDPNYPDERLMGIVSDSSIKHLIIESKFSTKFDIESLNHIQIDKEFDDISNASIIKPKVNIAGDSTAYVIFTSGSTGKPKGVVVKHKAVLNLLCALQKKPGIAVDDVYLAIISISFDPSIIDFFLPLITGASIIIASSEQCKDGTQLKHLLEHTGASIMNATPVIWQVLVDLGWRPKGTFKALCGGDILSPQLAFKLADRVTELWNMYGPTEATVAASCYLVPKSGSPIMIGKPLANNHIYILDSNALPLPVGIPGELHIGGQQVASGYLNNPDLTKEKFIPDPFCDFPGSKLYKTGDIARFQSDGSIEFLGRDDFQVKIRGNRIELSEIESRLEAHESVKQAVAIVKELAPGDTRVAAYVVPVEHYEIIGTEMRKHLRKNLPDYMIPQYFFEEQSLPLTPAGKIDRKLLASRFHIGEVKKEQFIAPVSDSEKYLASVWMETLKVEKVSIHHNFFDIGGHSLLAMQLIAKISQDTGVKINPRDMLLLTLAQIADQYPLGVKEQQAEIKTRGGVLQSIKNSFKKLH